MDHSSALYLDVPVTDAEHQEVHYRRSFDNHSSTLLGDSPSQHSENDHNVSRFPSLQSRVIKNSPNKHSRLAHSTIYTPISPVEDGGQRPSISKDEGSLHEAGRYHQNLGPSHTLWSSIWLRRSTLALFALLFIFLLTGLVVLEFLSRKFNGFYVAPSTSHYSWTYAPTAVLVILVALWRQVDYSAKLLIPWTELQNGPVTATRSLLLDYISPFQLVSVYQAFKLGHTSVIATIAGFMLLKLITLFSTGLLTLLPTTISKTDLPVISTLNFHVSPSEFATYFKTFPTAPLDAYYGSLARGLPLADGVTTEFAYIPLGFNPAAGVALPSNATLFGEVDAFVPTINCHEVDTKLIGPTTTHAASKADGGYYEGAQGYYLDAGAVCQNWTWASIRMDDPLYTILPARKVVGVWDHVYCYNEDLTLAPNPPAASRFTVAEFHYEQNVFPNASSIQEDNGEFPIANDTSRSTTKLVTVMCTSSYSIGRVNVTNHTSTDESKSNMISLSPLSNLNNRSIPKLTTENMTNLLDAAKSAADTMFETLPDFESLSSDTIFVLMAMNYKTQNLSVLLDPEKLATAAEKTYKGIFSQFAAKSLTKTANDTVAGSTVTFQQNRLHFNDLALGIMLAGFAILVIISMMLVFISPQAVVAQNPAAIAAVATTLTRSFELNKLLRTTVNRHECSLKTVLERFEFGAAIVVTGSGSKCFKILPSAGMNRRPTSKISKTSKFWCPLTVTRPVFIIANLLPITIIVVLEILQRSSDEHNGFYEVPQTKWTYFDARYVPALVMLVVATLINMIDFNIALFSPWSKLARGNSTSAECVTSRILGQSPPFALWEAVKSHSFGAIMSLTAAVAASVLTVVVSGLYTVNHFTLPGPNLPLTRLDTFELKFPNSFSNDNLAGTVTNLIEHLGLDYPEYTYADLVLPSFSIDFTKTPQYKASGTGGSTSAVLPALRANLRCDIMANTALDIFVDYAAVASVEAGPNDIDVVGVDFKADLPSTCMLGGKDTNQSSLEQQNLFFLLFDGKVQYAGQQSDLIFGAGAASSVYQLGDDYGAAESKAGSDIKDSPPVGCPSLAFSFGRFQKDKRISSQITSIICYQEIQKVKANVTFESDGKTIDGRHPPVVDESSVILQPNPLSDKDIKSFDFRIQQDLYNQMTTFDTAISVQPDSTKVLPDPLDIFFQSALNGSTKYDLATLAGPQGSQRLVQALQKFYRIYMAQVIHANMRRPISENDNTGKKSSSHVTRDLSTTLGNMSTTVLTPRLVQNNGPKLALQVLLGIIVLCMAAAYFTTSMRHVLPCNPCTIAGTMSLLAGSDLCHSHDDEICQCCGRPRRLSSGNKDAKNLAKTEAHTSMLELRDDNDNNEDHHREQLIPDGIEWLDQSSFYRAFADKRYSMGWWRERPDQGRSRRFGVDVGQRADGADDQDWELGRSKSVSEVTSGEVTMHGAAYHDDDDISPALMTGNKKVQSHLGNVGNSPRKVGGIIHSDMQENI